MLDSMAQEILAAHNKYRAEAGVPPVEWSDELASQALDWANQLTASQSFHHSGVKGEGENIWMGTSGAYSFTQMVDSFGNEKRYFIPGEFPDVSTTGSWFDVGHYTQMIWSDTTQVGCAGVDGPDGYYRFVCRYSPPGDVKGQRVGYPKHAGSVVAVYEDANFQGKSAALGVGRYDWGHLGIANDTLSSLRVPPGLAAMLCEDTRFGGRSKIFTHDASYVGDDFNDITSSIIVANTSTGSKTLNFLRIISGLRTVAGQHNREPNSDPAKWTNAIHDACGKFPGLWSGDFLYEQDNIDSRGTMISEAKNQWSHGALINLMYHAAPPNQGEPCGWEGGVLSHLSDDEWNQLITDGSDLNNKWKARLDVISVFLQHLKDHGVEALWRPFHEMNQGNFWWGGRPGPQGTARLYQLTHDYMVGTKGLNNLTWVWDIQDLDFNWAPYNPGDGYWDVLAMDMYGDGYTAQKYETILQLAGDKPIAIGECKILPTAQELAAQPRWTFFMAWAELVFSDNGTVTNSVQQIKDLYDAAPVVPRDQVPGWGWGVPSLPK